MGMLERHRQVALETNIMYINEVPFIITTSRNIHFCTAELIKNEKADTIATLIKQVIQMYQRRGFTIRQIHGDGQFEHIKKFFADTDIYINITGWIKHVPGVERLIRMLKERIRALVNQLLFDAYPHRLIIEMVYNVVFWINRFPQKDGIHEYINPE